MADGGDHVEAGEPLVEVSTDKVEVEIPADASSDLREIRVQAGRTVPVGTIIAMIEPQADRPSEASPAAERAAACTTGKSAAKSIGYGS